MNDNWTTKRITPRPIIRKPDFYRVWVIDAPGTVSGDADDTVYSDFIDIPDPKPFGTGLFAVPNMDLELETGGNLTATVEFFDEKDEEDGGLVSSADVRALATGETVAYAVAGTSSTSAPDGWTHQTGTFTSTWTALTHPIPAGTGKAFGLVAIMVAGGFDPVTTYPPYINHVSMTCYLELGDADGNVVASIEMADYQWAYTTPFDSSQTIDGTFESGQSVTLSGTATQTRCKMIVHTNHYCSPYCRIETGGTLEIQA